MRNEKQLLERYTNLLNALKSSENSGVNPWSVTALCGMSQTIPTVMLRMGYLSNTTKEYTLKIGKIEPIHARRLMEYVRDHASQARKIPKKPGIKMKQKFKPHPVQIA
jgi:DNA-binding transcriptional regulator WhiA